MPFNAKVYRVLISSPGDLYEERSINPGIINEWNSRHSFDYRVVLLPVLWETHVCPQFGVRPQELINNQIVSRADILIGLFWTRIGTPTGFAKSGTIEEIEEFRKLGKPVLLYFKNTPASPEIIDSKQIKSLQNLKKRYKKQGLIMEYVSPADFERMLSRHLLDLIRDKEGSPYDISVKETIESARDKIRGW